MNYQFMRPLTIVLVDSKKSKYKLVMIENGKILARQANARTDVGPQAKNCV